MGSIGDWTDVVAIRQYKKHCPVLFCKYQTDNVCGIDDEFVGAVDADNFYYIPNMEYCSKSLKTKDELNEINNDVSSLEAQCESFRWEWDPPIINPCDLCGAEIPNHFASCWYSYNDLGQDVGY